MKLKLKLYSLLSLLLLTAFLVGCDKEDNKLKSEEISLLYQLNNKQAAIRFSSIMYNREDTTQIEERFKIVHISDAHLSSWSSDNDYRSPNNLKEAVRFANQTELKMNALVAAGDLIANAQKADALNFMESFYTNLYRNNRVPTFSCLGNHDSNMTEVSNTESIDKSALYSMFDNRGNYSLNREEGQNYYYADVPNPMGGMIRIIALDMLDQTEKEYNTLHAVVYSKEQIEWLINKALKEGMSKDHRVIILTHYPFQPPHSPYVNTYLIDGYFVHPWNMVPEIVEAFREKKSLKKSYKNKTKEELISVDADFSHALGDFICYLGGHIHATVQFSIVGLSNQSKTLLPQQMLLCTNMSPSEIGVYFNRVPRTSHSLNSNAFCLYSVDTKERKIYITFFGAYKPTTSVDYPEVQVLSY